MSLTLLRHLPAFVPVLVILTSPGPAYADGSRPAATAVRAPRTTSRQLELYSPRLRRSMATYLKLRLLELREAGLDRARAAIERRVSIDELLAEPARPESPQETPSPSRRSLEPLRR